MGNERRYICKDPRQISGSRNISYTRYSKKRFTQTFDLSLGLRNVLTEKAWEIAVLGLGNEAGIKRGKRRKGKRKGRKRQKIEGKEEGKKRAHSPFLRHPFYGRLFRRLT